MIHGEIKSESGIPELEEAEDDVLYILDGILDGHLPLCGERKGSV